MKAIFQFDRSANKISMVPEDPLEEVFLQEVAESSARGATITVRSVETNTEFPTYEVCIVR